MRLLIGGAVLLVMAVVVACGGGSDDNESGSTISDAEVADALVEFAEAFANNNSIIMSGFWSGTCSSEDVAALDSASQSLAGQFSDYQLVVGDGLVIDTTDDRAVVPKEQPDGALLATAVISGQEVPLDEPLLFEGDVEFVFEEGSLRVVNCGDLFVGDDQEPGEEVDE